MRGLLSWLVFLALYFLFFFSEMYSFAILKRHILLTVTNWAKYETRYNRVSYKKTVKKPLLAALCKNASSSGLTQQSSNIPVFSGFSCTYIFILSIGYIAKRHLSKHQVEIGGKIKSQRQAAQVNGSDTIELGSPKHWWFLGTESWHFSTAQKFIKSIKITIGWLIRGHNLHYPPVTINYINKTSVFRSGSMGRGFRIVPSNKQARLLTD